MCMRIPTKSMRCNKRFKPLGSVCGGTKTIYGPAMTGA